MPFFVCGVHPVEETLDVLPKTILGESRLWIAESRSQTDIQAILASAAQKHVPVMSCAMSALDEKAGETRHQGVLLEVRAFPYSDLDEVLSQASSKPLLVVLDQIQDPHNLGAIMRTAACVGADGIIIEKNRSVSLNATVAKVSAGAIDIIKVAEVTNLSQALKALKKEGYWVIGASLKTEKDYRSVDYDMPLVLVVGSEGEGMRRLVEENCDILVKMPLCNDMDSLNASVAAGIMLYTIYDSRFPVR